MTNEIDKSPEIVELLDTIAIAFFGISRTKAIDSKVCVACQGEAKVFRNQVSYKEYGLTGYCQACQDEVFGAD